MAIDGGANVVYDLMRKFRLDNHDEWLPHVVSGDFDSIRSEVLTSYQNRKVKIIHTPDQDETDFFKGLKAAVTQTEVSNNLKSLVGFRYLKNRREHRFCFVILKFCKRLSRNYIIYSERDITVYLKFHFKV